VQVQERSADLLENAEHGRGRERVDTLDEAPDGALLGVFENKEHFVTRLRVQDLDQPQNMRMPDQPHEPDFPLELRQAGRGADQIGDPDLLDCIDLPAPLIDRAMDARRAAAPDLLLKKVAIDLLDGTRLLKLVLRNGSELPQRIRPEHGNLVGVVHFSNDLVLRRL
jgi:hypothetical protein